MILYDIVYNQPCMYIIMQSYMNLHLHASKRKLKQLHFSPSIVSAPLEKHKLPTVLGTHKHTRISEGGLVTKHNNGKHSPFLGEL